MDETAVVNDAYETYRWWTATVERGMHRNAALGSTKSAVPAIASRVVPG